MFIFLVITVCGAVEVQLQSYSLCMYAYLFACINFKQFNLHTQFYFFFINLQLRQICSQDHFWGFLRISSIYSYFLEETLVKKTRLLTRKMQSLLHFCCAFAHQTTVHFSWFKCGLISVSNILKRAPMHAKARLIDVILFLCVVFSAPFNWQSCGLLWSGVLEATTRRQILCSGIITFSDKS